MTGLWQVPPPRSPRPSCLLPWPRRGLQGSPVPRNFGGWGTKFAPQKALKRKGLCPGPICFESRAFLDSGFSPSLGPCFPGTEFEGERERWEREENSTNRGNGDFEGWACNSEGEIEFPGGGVRGSHFSKLIVSQIISRVLGSIESRTSFLGAVYVLFGHLLA